VYFTEQEPLESLHTSAESFPEPLADQVTFPVGENPVTVTVSLIAEPTTTDGTEPDKVTGESEVEVEAAVTDDIVEAAEAVGAAVVLVLLNIVSGRGTVLAAVVADVVDVTTTPEAAGAKVSAAEQEASNRTMTAITVSLSRDDAHHFASPPLFKE
jgi:hypothetical protein